MKKILITTDFSSYSEQTIRFVLDLLRSSSESGQIILLHTYTVYGTDPGSIIPLNDRLKEESRQGLEFQKEWAMKINTNPNIQIHVLSRMGSSQNIIAQILQHEKPDLVVFGELRAGELERVHKDQASGQ